MAPGGDFIFMIIVESMVYLCLQRYVLCFSSATLTVASNSRNALGVRVPSNLVGHLARHARQPETTALHQYGNILQAKTGSIS